MQKFLFSLRKAGQSIAETVTARKDQDTRITILS